MVRFICEKICDDFIKTLKPVKWREYNQNKDERVQIIIYPVVLLVINELVNFSFQFFSIKNDGPTTQRMLAVLLCLMECRGVSESRYIKEIILRLKKVS